jgi:uncharacterized protein (DUF983 family)
MGQVIELATKKSFAPPREAPQATQTGLVYECSHCHAKDQLFKLFADGTVRCGDCDARMNNLMTAYKAKGAA